MKNARYSGAGGSGVNGCLCLTFHGIKKRAKRINRQTLHNQGTASRAAYSASQVHYTVCVGCLSDLCNSFVLSKVTSQFINRLWVALIHDANLNNSTMTGLSILTIRGCFVKSETTGKRGMMKVTILLRRNFHNLAVDDICHQRKLWSPLSYKA